MLVGLQVKVEINAGATRLSAAVWEELPRVAVIVALWLLVIVPRDAVNVEEVLPAATVTDAGTVSDALLLEMVTALPPVGAAWLKVIVQVLEEPEFTLVGLQTNDETNTGATKLIVVVIDALPRLAVTTAL